VEGGTSDRGRGRLRPQLQAATAGNGQDPGSRRTFLRALAKSREEARHVVKRIIGATAALILLALATPRTSWAFGVKDVEAMSQYGIPDSLIIEKIQHSGTEFHLDAKDLKALKEAGVDDDVVVAMLRTEDRDRSPIYYDGYWWPYHPAWYVGLDFGYYAPFHRYYRPLYRPIYRPIYRPYVGGGVRYRGHVRGRR
jgi:hypothetical protein